MTDIEAAERTIAALTDKLDRATARLTQIAEERKAIGFAVHADGDPAARKRLDQLNVDDAAMAGELQSLDAAIVEARTRLAQAQQAAATAVDRKRAAELRKTFDKFVALGEEADRALATFLEASTEMKEAMDKIHSFGGGAPTGQQFLTFGQLALDAVLMFTRRGSANIAISLRATGARSAISLAAGAMEPRRELPTGLASNRTRRRHDEADHQKIGSTKFRPALSPVQEPARAVILKSQAVAPDGFAVLKINVTGQGPTHDRLRVLHDNVRRGNPHVTSDAHWAAAWNSLTDAERDEIRREEAASAAAREAEAAARRANNIKKG